MWKKRAPTFASYCGGLSFFGHHGATVSHFGGLDHAGPHIPQTPSPKHKLGKRRRMNRVPRRNGTERCFPENFRRETQTAFQKPPKQKFPVPYLGLFLFGWRCPFYASFLSEPTKIKHPPPPQSHQANVPPTSHLWAPTHPKTHRWETTSKPPRELLSVPGTWGHNGPHPSRELNFLAPGTWKWVPGKFWINGGMGVQDHCPSPGNFFHEEGCCFASGPHPEELKSQPYTYTHSPEVRALIESKCSGLTFPNHKTLLWNGGNPLLASSGDLGVRCLPLKGLPGAEASQEQALQGGLFWVAIFKHWRSPRSPGAPGVLPCFPGTFLERQHCNRLCSVLWGPDLRETPFLALLFVPCMWIWLFSSKAQGRVFIFWVFFWDMRFFQGPTLSLKCLHFGVNSPPLLIKKHPWKRVRWFSRSPPPLCGCHGFVDHSRCSSHVLVRGVSWRERPNR